MLMEVTSHPMWVRGLKPKVWYNRGFGMNVAPYVGAWIGTFRMFCRPHIEKLRPMWVCV